MNIIHVLKICSQMQNYQKNLREVIINKWIKGEAAGKLVQKVLSWVFLSEKFETG